MELYTIMAIKANEIQNLKKQIGFFDQYDMIVRIGNGAKLLAMQLETNKVDDKIAWIPTQNNIQSLIMQLQPKLSLIVEDFSDWYSEDKEFYDSVLNLTFDCLYIMYYMERYQRKFWCWGCGYWKDIKYKDMERKERKVIQSRVFEKK